MKVVGMNGYVPVALNYTGSDTLKPLINTYENAMRRVQMNKANLVGVIQAFSKALLQDANAVKQLAFEIRYDSMALAELVRLSISAKYSYSDVLHNDGVDVIRLNSLDRIRFRKDIILHLFDNDYYYHYNQLPTELTRNMAREELEDMNIPARQLYDHRYSFGWLGFLGCCLD
ncbi:MAG: hypothetical protein VW397_08850 [Candidatus Margulisiibacteriota bacterium]